jgi:hypothetical protein
VPGHVITGPQSGASAGPGGSAPSGAYVGVTPGPATTQPTAIPQPQAKTPASQQKKKTAVLAAVAALVVIAAIVGSALWYRSRQVPPTQTVAPATPADPAPASTAVIEPTSPPVTPGSGAAAAAGTGAGTTAAVGTAGGGKESAPGSASGTGTAPVNPAGLRGAKGSAVGTTGVPPTSATPPPANDPLLAIPNVKLYVVNGKRTDDRDVQLNFAGGQLAVLPRSGGEALGSIPYANIAKATYVKARNPLWDKALPSPPDDLDVGSFFFRQSRHWLVIQTNVGFTVLRLEDNNAPRVLAALSERTGVTVDRPRSSDK